MAKLGIDLSDALIDGVKSLAAQHYGDSGDASIDRVVESALEMRLLSIRLVEQGGNEVEEPLASWEFPNEQPVQQSTVEIQDWLFRRG